MTRDNTAAANVAKKISGGHFIPFRKRDLIHCCSDDELLGRNVDRPQFAAVCRLIESIYHHQFHEKLEALKNQYAPFDPDRDTYVIDEPDTNHPVFQQRLRELMKAANYREITKQQLQLALHKDSLLKVRLQVDFDAFEDALLFYRGETEFEEELRSWFGLRRKKITVPAFDRVVVMLRPKGTGAGIVLKLFKNVPRADLEMLFPNPTAHMKPIDKLMIAVPAVVSSGVVLFTKLGATLLLVGGFISFWLGFSDREVTIDQTSLIALGAGLASLGAVLWREFNKFKNRKLAFMKALTENLYFKNLDNNQGVLQRLIDSAEEEECKEAILGYFMLLRSGEAMTSAQLDAAVETWFSEQLQCELDFDIADSLKKLTALQIVRAHEGSYSAEPVNEAIRLMDVYWDGIFVPA